MLPKRLQPMTTSAVSPAAVQGGRVAKGGAWLWLVTLWTLFILYCAFLVAQVVDKTKHPVQATSYQVENGFSAPSILLCSFGSYNLSYFEAAFPNLYGGRWQMLHNFSDMLEPAIANYSHPWQSTLSSNNVSYTADAYGRNDLVTFSQNLNTSTAGDGYPNFSDNFATPQLLGMVRSAAVIQPDVFETYNGLNNTRWCVMWTPYRLTLQYPPSNSSSHKSVDTGSVWNRQLSSRQVFRVAINLYGAAIQQDEAWQWVSSDSIDTPRLESGAAFPPLLSVQFVDFGGKREEEWLWSSASSKYMQDVLQHGDPDGFELVTLNNNHELSVQKQVTTTLSGFQKLGWPWRAWPWSDDSPYQQTQYVVRSSASAQLGEPGFYQTSVTGGAGNVWTHTLVIGVVRSTRLTFFISDVPAVVGLLGNFGGAYSLMVVVYGLLYAVQSPHIETAFQFPGQSSAKWLWSNVRGWRCFGCRPSWRRTQFHKFSSLQQARSGSGPSIEVEPGARTAMSPV